MTGWTQPTLDGASCRAFAITATHRFPTGWSGSLTVIQEGEVDRVEMMRFTELDSAQMCAALALALEQVVVLLGGS